MRLGALVFLAACGLDDIDLGGVYQVTSAVGSAPCGTDEPIAFAPFVHFERRELAGSPFYAFDGCAEAQAANCTAVGGFIGGFFEPIDDGWLGFASFSSGGGDAGDCRLGVTEQTAIRDGATLTIEVRTFEDTVEDLAAEFCTPADAELRFAGTLLACVDHRRAVATKI
jgi:hypothetical protein